MTTLQEATVIISNDPARIRLGASAYDMTIDNYATYPGFYADGAGNFRGGGATNSVVYTVGTGVLAVTGTITAAAGTIGGWTITTGYIYALASGTPTSSPNDGIVIGSTNPAIKIYENTEKRVELGYLASGIYGVKGYDDDGSTVLFEISDNQKYLAGADLSATALAVSSNIILDFGNKMIALNDSTFGHAGIQLQYNAGSPRAYFGDGSNEYMKYVAGSGVEISTAAATGIKVKSGGGISVEDGGNITLNSGGDVILYGDDSDPAVLAFFGDGGTDGCYYYTGNAGTACYVTPVSSGDTSYYMGLSSSLFLEIKGYAASEIEFWSYNSSTQYGVMRVNSSGTTPLFQAVAMYDSDTYGAFTITSDSTPEADLGLYYDANDYIRWFLAAGDNTSYAELISLHNGTEHRIGLSSNFYPYPDNAVECGTDTYAWSVVTSFVWDTESDLYCLDDLDDLGIINAIKGSGAISDIKEPFEVIDDNTVDPRLFSTYKKDTYYPRGHELEGQLKGKAGDIKMSSRGKPLSDLGMWISLLIGAMRQEDNKHEALLSEFMALKADYETLKSSFK